MLIDPIGNLQFLGLDPVMADTLARLPEILRSVDPAVRERLHPETFVDDETAQEEWERFATPELEHLFASRIELIERDLGMLGADEDGELSFVIPIQHRTAWLSALNAGRLTLHVEAGLSADELAVEPGASGDEERDLALARIDTLALVQHLVIEAREVVWRRADLVDDPDEDLGDEPDEDPDETDAAT